MPSDRTAGPSSGPGVCVEVVLLSLHESGDHVGYRVVRSDLDPDEHPDVAALLLAGCSRPDVSHATSWRYDDGRVVLTYAVVPDPATAGAEALVEPSIVWSGDATRPSPADLHEHHVVAHAVRHLAGLATTDPGVRRAAAMDSTGLWQLIDACADLPVALHESLPHDRSATPG